MISSADAARCARLYGWRLSRSTWDLDRYGGVIAHEIANNYSDPRDLAVPLRPFDPDGWAETER